MEFTFASAFSTGGLVGHFAYVLLIISMIMRRMVLLRIFVIASALVGIVYAVVWLNDPVSSFWETLLVAVNAIQLAITWRQNSIARFTDEEREFCARRLRGLSAHEQRKLLSLGEWIDLPKGHDLTTEGDHPDWLFYIVSGTVEVVVGRKAVATCGSGCYIGELAYISGQPASATVVTRESVRVWRIGCRTLSEINTERPSWMSALEAGIARDLRQKILSLNEIKSVSTIGIT